jgi:hypothetical protein
MAQTGFEIPLDAGQAQTAADTARTLWAGRDARMDEEESAWALEQPMLDKGEISFQLATAATQVNKPTRMMSAVDLLLEVAPETEDSRQDAQAIEDFGRWAWDEVALRHVSATGHLLQQSIAHYINGRGWLTYTLMLNRDDPSFPFKFQLLDPRQVYPDTLHGEPCCTMHRYRSTIRELLYQWPAVWVQAALNLTPESLVGAGNNPVECIGFYTPYETAFLTDGRWLKPPTEHGYTFNPLVRVYREGAPAGVQDQRGTLADPSRYIGMGTLTSLLPTIRDVQKVAIMAATVLRDTAQAVRVFKTQGSNAGEAFDEETRTVTIQVDEAFDQIYPPAVSIQEAQALLNLGTDSVNREGVGPALFGIQPALSGYQDKVNQGSATDVLTSSMECMRMGLQLFFRHLFKLFVLYGEMPDAAPSIRYVAVDRQSGLRTAANRLSPLQVLGADTRTLVRLGDVSPRDQAALVNTAAQAVRENLYDIEGAHRDILRSPNPTAAAKAARQGVLEKDPQYQMLRALMEKLGNPNDPAAQQAAYQADPDGWTVAQQMYQAIMVKMMGPPPGAGASATGAPGQPPLPGLGQPQGTLPADMGVNAGMAPNQAPLAPQQNGAAMQSIV